MDSFEIANQKVIYSSSENMEQIENDSITLVVTSPPYWNVRDYGGDQIGFNQSYVEYVNSLNKVWSECIRVLQPNGKIAINVQPLPISADLSGFDRQVIKDIMFDIEHFMFNAGMFLSGMIFWDKTAYINNVSWGSYPKPTNIATNTAFEHIYTFVKSGKTGDINRELQEKSLLSKNEWRHWAVRMVWDDISPVIKINQKKENLFGHGVPFPEDIPYRLIRMHTIEGETVLDPFLGSGTTLKMARISKRKGIGYEINSEYHELICSRIMEEWTPPRIDSQYKTLSSVDLGSIITSSITLSMNKIDTLMSSESFNINNDFFDNLKYEIQQDILKDLKKKNILTSANIKRILQYFREKQLD